jgi:methanogenic corrinoid protein MtbC1
MLYDDVVAPALVDVGQLWDEGKISIADEHIATAITQSVLATFYGTFSWATDGPKAILACVPGERHELGARMAADLFANDGWNIIYVGADVPQEALLGLVLREAPLFVGLSLGMLDRVAAARDVIAELRRAAPQTRIIVGGRVAASPQIAPIDAIVIAGPASKAVEQLREWKR